ncbi:MAG TPA: hypothetical protein VFP68_21515, partial [Burkholderiaceae bacterium]|nr:hypothetical protein [Burkholderiaceae bacterium]
MNAVVDETPSNITGDPASPAPTEAEVISLSDFIDEFGAELLQQVRSQNPPIYDGTQRPAWNAVMDGLKRKPFAAQRDAVQAVAELLIGQDAPSAILNAEMGSGKSMMAICTAAVLMSCGLRRCLVISPPHLVYKWRREIKETVPGARVWVLNGPDTLRKLLMLRAALGGPPPKEPEFFVLGRVRMRMGFHWRPAFNVRRTIQRGLDGHAQRIALACCPKCGKPITLPTGDGEDMPVSPELAAGMLSDKRAACASCSGALWTLMRPGRPQRSFKELVLDALKQMPTIGDKTARRLIDTFGEDLLGSMLGDNLYEFLYLMDERGNLVFSDRQAARMERSLANFEFSFGEGGYQPTEFIKRGLPQGYFGLLVVDEGHVRCGFEPYVRPRLARTCSALQQCAGLTARRNGIHERARR